MTNLSFENKVTLLVLKPMVTVSLQEDLYIKGGEELEIPFSIKNIGTAPASDLSVNYRVDDELLDNVTLPDLPREVNASSVLPEMILLDTEGIAYGEYSLVVEVAYRTPRNETKSAEKKSTIHIMGPTEEEINQETLAKAGEAERDAGIFLTRDEYGSALEEYQEAKKLYEAVGLTTKVAEMNDKITLVGETIEKIQMNTEKADQEFQAGEGYLYDDNYPQALEKTKSAKALYNQVLSLTKDNEPQRTLYEEKISECEERIQYLEQKVADEESEDPETPELETVFVGAIIFLLIALIFGIILIRRE